ncbi:hypothetical protein ACO0LL_28260 [Undibacterium sp. TC4M20W]|uniref:hypothetical protein n=1 Tax=Undibacterium sp. TC4M20W TaxID=3413052 RepID=UPI003BF295E9
MNIPSSKLLSLLGKNHNDPDVLQAIGDNHLLDMYDDPPYCRYIGSKQQGIDLLFEEQILVDVQFFIQKTRLYSAFLGVLPFGIKNGMSQLQVHELLGMPDKFHQSDSRYFMREDKLQVVLAFDSDGIVSYLGVALPM